MKTLIVYATTILVLSGLTFACHAQTQVYLDSIFKAGDLFSNALSNDHTADVLGDTYMNISITPQQILGRTVDRIEIAQPVGVITLFNGTERHNVIYLFNQGFDFNSASARCVSGYFGDGFHIVLENFKWRTGCEANGTEGSTITLSFLADGSVAVNVLALQMQSCDNYLAGEGFYDDWGEYQPAVFGIDYNSRTLDLCAIGWSGDLINNHPTYTLDCNNEFYAEGPYFSEAPVLFHFSNEFVSTSNDPPRISLNNKKVACNNLIKQIKNGAVPVDPDANYMLYNSFGQALELPDVLGSSYRDNAYTGIFYITKRTPTSYLSCPINF